MNLGICFYKIGLLEEAYTCLETCIMSLKNNKFMNKYTPNGSKPSSNLKHRNFNNNNNTANNNYPLNLLNGYY